MIRFILFLIPFIELFAFEYKSQTALKYIGYEDSKNEFLADGDLKLKVQNELFTTNIKLEYLYSYEYKKRRYLLLNELYLSKEYEDYIFEFGKSIKYWGTLEGYNIADIYNHKNYLKDPFDKSEKLGSFGMDIGKYFDEDSLELGIKFYEDDIKYGDQQTPYFPFPIRCDDELQLSEKRYTPSVYLAYSLTSENIIESENKLILYSGYDSKRYFVPSDNLSLSQYAYRVNKLVFLSTIIYEDTIFKTEMTYTDVVDDENISDYYQLSFGVEKNLYGIAGSDLGLYLEYYKYTYKEDGKVEGVDISEIYDDDIFFALKLNLNDVKSSEIKAGLTYDLQSYEKFFKAKLKSRLFDNLVLEAEYLNISSNSFENKMNLGLAYIF